MVPWIWCIMGRVGYGGKDKAASYLQDYRKDKTGWMAVLPWFNSNPEPEIYAEGRDGR